MADLATAEVSLEVDFANLEPDVRKGLEERVKRAARSAQRELDETTLAAAALGSTIDREVGGAAERSAARVRKAARDAAGELDRLGRAGADAGAGIARGAGQAAAGVDRLTDAARDAADTLFDVGDDGVVRLNQAIREVQASLFDLDTVELDRGNDRALTFAQTLRRSVREAADDVRIGLRLAFENTLDGAVDLGARGSAAIGRLVDRLGDLEPATVRPLKGIGRLRAGILSLVGVGLLVAPAVAAAGAGVGAFAAVALPSIVRVIQAQTEMAERWDSLTTAEKVAAAQTKALTKDFKDLAAELSPATLQVYNGAIANLGQLLPPLKPVAAGVLGALKDLNQEIGEGFESDRAREFFAFLTREAGPSVDLLGGLLIDLAAAFASVVQALAPLAGAGIGVLSFFTNLLTAVGDLSPELLQFLAVVLALRAPLGALGGFFVTTGNKAKAFAKETRGAALASRALALAQAGLPGILIAGVAGLVLFATQLSKNKTIHDQLADSINAVNRASGNNLAGYQAANKVFQSQLAPSYDRINKAVAEYNRNATINNLEVARGALVAASLSDANNAAFAAQNRNNAAIANITEGAAALGVQYGITAEQAIQLADAAGINLSKGIVRAGVVSASAIDKINGYRSAAELARNPTAALGDALSITANESLKLEDRINALSTALNVAANPSLALFAAQNRLNEAVSEGRRIQGDANATQEQRRASAERIIGTIRAMAEAEFASEKNVDGASRALRDQLPRLRDLVSGSKDGRKAVADLRTVLDGLEDKARDAGKETGELGKKIDDLPAKKSIELSLATGGAEGQLQGLLNRIGFARPVIPVALRPPGGATGGLILPGAIVRRAGGVIQRRAGGLLRGPGTGTSDSITALVDGGRGGLARVSTGEFVVNAKATRRHYGLIKAINAGAFRAGGLLGGVRARMQALAAGGTVRRYATGGRVDAASRRALVDVGALLGGAIAAGLKGSRAAIAKETEKIRKTLETKIVAIGQTVGAGFAKSITGSPSEINSAFLRLEKQITKAFVGIDTKVDDRLVKRLDGLNDKLATLARRRDALTGQIEEATRVSASVADRARDFASILSFDDTENVTPEALATTLRNRLRVLQGFQDDISALTRRGLDKGIVQALAESPGEGIGLARTLAGASDEVLREITALQRSINKTSTTFGRGVADSLFDAGRQAGKGFLAGLKAERGEITKLLTEIAQGVAKTVKTTLKIKSPSLVLRRLAVDTLRGYIAGIRDLTARVRETVAAAVTPSAEVRRAAALAPARATPAPGPRPAAPAATSRPIQFTQNNNFYNAVVDPGTVAAVTENRLIAALRGI